SQDQLAYEELVTNILEEEDDVVACHRQQIEDNMALVQEEMGLLTQDPGPGTWQKEIGLLTQVEMPGGSVDAYVRSLVEKPGGSVDAYVEMPGGSVDAYVRSLDRVLERKIAAVEKLRQDHLRQLLMSEIAAVEKLRQRLSEFQQRLKEEETLSKTRRL
ncbi:hypothetical protein T484DRAFT_1805250, partial [Baffinella frigidus]